MKENLDPDSTVKTAVITTLIYGNKSAAPQTEEGIKQLAAVIQDMNGSQACRKHSIRITTDADEWFKALRMEVKGWCFSGIKPPEAVSEDGKVGVDGMCWEPELDTIELKYAPLHFGSVSRGRIKA